MERLPPKSRLHIYLLLGQSNMAGRGRLEDVPRIQDARILTFTRDNQWSVAVEPIHFDKPEIAGVGPGPAFAGEMLRHEPGTKIGLVPCAMGGSALDEWAKGQPLFATAIARARAAMETGTLAGALWHQGEADSTPERAPTYAVRLERMFEDLRMELDVPSLPIAVAETGRFWSGEFDEHPDPLSPARIVNDSLRALAGSMPDVGFVDSKNLYDGGDKLHFDAASARELGRRYAAAMFALQDSEAGFAR